MERLLVGTVFAKDDEEQRRWLELQLSHLKKTTENFEHVSVVWGGASSFYELTTVIEPESYVQGSEAHVKGLNYLLKFFNSQQQSFDHFLFLDSDAFPIRVGWMDDLLKKMQPSPVFRNGEFWRMEGKDYEIAIPIRAENLETRIHASILFAKKEALPHLSFANKNVGMDLCGNMEGDVCVTAYQNERRLKVWPLMRSNQFNVHPVACGVYYDMFYHHGCGSGREDLRTMLRSGDYWDITTDEVSQYTRRLMSDPKEFVSKLAGWRADSYV